MLRLRKEHRSPKHRADQREISRRASVFIAQMHLHPGDVVPEMPQRLLHRRADVRGQAIMAVDMDTGVHLNLHRVLLWVGVDGVLHVARPLKPHLFFSFMASWAPSSAQPHSRACSQNFSHEAFRNKKDRVQGERTKASGIAPTRLRSRCARPFYPLSHFEKMLRTGPRPSTRGLWMCRCLTGVRMPAWH